jgi:putative DNA primase/helicase
LTSVIGAANVCAPTLASLGTNFGLWALIGKQLGIIADARLSGRSDQAIVTERLLSITGEDSLTIDRKNIVPITLRLPTRLMLLTNELPRLSDASGALSSRFIVLTLTTSFLGREDLSLEDRLKKELPSILLWSIAGRQRLHIRGKFAQPLSSQAVIDELEDLAAPISAFIRDCCEIKSGLTTPVSSLFNGWCSWCKSQGRDAPGNLQTFGRDLRAAFPHLKVVQHRGENRYRSYEGIDLSPDAKVELANLTF